MDERPIFSVVQVIEAVQAATQLREGETVMVRLSDLGATAFITPQASPLPDGEVAYGIRVDFLGVGITVTGPNGRPFENPEGAIDAAVLYLYEI